LDTEVLFLVSNKAFSIVQKNASEFGNEVEFRMNHENNSINTDPLHDNLVASIANKVYFEPKESGPVLYNLFGGPELQSLHPSSPECLLVSMKRIDAIVTYNAFGSLRNEPFTTEEPSPFKFSGLWITPAFFNHSCVDYNASWGVYGDLMVIRALKPIMKGEEILIKYMEPGEEEARKNYMRNHHFICGCRLCAFESTEVRGRVRRAKLQSELLDSLAKLNQGLKSSKSGLKQARNVVKKLSNLRSNAPNFNFSLTTPPVINFGSELFKYGHFSECRELLTKIYSIQKDNGNIKQAIGIGVNILRTSLALNEQQKVKEWIATLKADLVVAFGSVLPMQIFGKETLDALKLQGIQFFE